MPDRHIGQRLSNKAVFSNFLRLFGDKNQVTVVFPNSWKNQIKG